jgi:WD40 repeat protein
MADTFRITVAFSADGRTVAAARVGPSDPVVSLCDVASRRETATIPRPLAESCAVAFSPDGRTLAVGRDLGITLHDVETGRERAELTADDAYDCVDLSFSADGRRLAAATGTGLAVVWETATGRVLGSFRARSRSLQGVALSPDGRSVASASDGPIVCHTIGGGFFGFGSRAVACGPDYGIVRLFDVATGQERATLKHDGTARSVSFSPDGQRLASGGGGAAKLWDLAAGRARTLLTVDSHLEVYCVSFSPDGRSPAIGVGSRDPEGSYSEVKLWDVERRRVRARLEGEMGMVRAMAFAPDGRALVTGSPETVMLWDVSSTGSNARWRPATARPAERSSLLFGRGHSTDCLNGPTASPAVLVSSAGLPPPG